VDLVRTDDSKERIASIIRVERINEVGTTMAVSTNCSTVRSKNAIQDRRAVEGIFFGCFV
jgi:hypothetical protein